MRRSCSLAAALSVLALAAPAAGAVRISAADSSAYPTVRATIVTTSPNEAAPTFRENGTPVAGLQTFNLAQAKSIVLAVDRSRSMAGASLANATVAATAFVNAKRGDDRIAVVTFGRQAAQLTGFSADPSGTAASLGTIAVDSTAGTALYDAVVTAAHALRTEPLRGRVIILLTDGHDVSSKATIADAVAAARLVHASLYPIAIASRDFAPAPLRELAGQTNGTYHVATSSRVLSTVYASIADELSRTWQVQYVTSARPGDAVNLTATVAGDGTAKPRLRLVGTGTAAGSDSSLPTASFSFLGTLAIALAVGVSVIGAALLLLSGVRGSWVKSRISPHIGAVRQGATRKDRLSFLASLYRATESSFGHWRQWRSVARMLERGDVPLRVVEFFWATVAAGVAFALLAAVFGSSLLVSLILAVAGGSTPYLFVSFRVRRRARAFEDQLPEVLSSVASALKAGHSFKQGLQAVVDEGHPPASDEFRRVLTETSLGRPMDDALTDMANRTDSPNFAFAITAVTIQRHVGGSLAGLFEMVAETVRQRQQFAAKIRGLTAMGRMSAYVLVGLPFFIGLAITAMNPSYMTPLFHTHAGRLLIVGGLVMMALGSLLLKKIVSFRG
jgi:tight adherence protein B